MQPAYQHLNLVRNPFGALTPQARIQVAVVDVAHLVDALKKPATAIQFLAGHGRGKTTHLLALHALIPEASYTQLQPGDEHVFTTSKLRFIDSVENLSRRSRKQLYKASESIALSTHKRLTFELKRNGYHVITIKVSTSDPKLLQDIFNRRIAHARRGSGTIPVLSDNDALVLKKRFKDDVRSMEHYLYDVFQSLDTPENLKLG